MKKSKKDCMLTEELKQTFSTVNYAKAVCRPKHSFKDMIGSLIGALIVSAFFAGAIVLACFVKFLWLLPIIIGFFALSMIATFLHQAVQFSKKYMILFCYENQTSFQIIFDKKVTYYCYAGKLYKLHKGQLKELKKKPAIFFLNAMISIENEEINVLDNCYHIKKRKNKKRNIYTASYRIKRHRKKILQTVSFKMDCVSGLPACFENEFGQYKYVAINTDSVMEESKNMIADFLKY